jgi:hypothetical protein
VDGNVNESLTIRCVQVVNREAMANPGCLDWYVALAKARESTELE